MRLTRQGGRHRMRTQDRRSGRARERLRPATWPGQPDPLAAAAPARLEALFLPCPGGGVHRQGQGLSPSRVRGEGFYRHQQPPGSPVACSCCTPGRCPITRMTATPCGTSSTVPRRSPDARSSGPMSTRDTAATTRKIPVASSSQARSVASSVSSSASCADVPPSSPSSDT